jgi:hypothetical protein
LKKDPNYAACCKYDVNDSDDLGDEEEELVGGVEEIHKKKCHLILKITF